MKWRDIKVGGIYKFKWDKKKDRYMLVRVESKKDKEITYSVIKDYHEYEWRHGFTGSMMEWTLLEESTEKEIDEAMVELI